MKKVLVIHKFISPIRTPLFVQMQEWYASHGYDMKVVYLKAKESHRQWDTTHNVPFTYSVLNQKSFEFGRKDVYTIHTGTAIIDELEEYQPDVVINFGWDHLSAYLTQRWCRKASVPFYLWADSTAYETSWRRTITVPLVRWFISRCSGYIAGGSRAKEYLVSLGASTNAVEVFYNTVDITQFQQRATGLPVEDAKQAIGVTTPYMVLFNGQLIQRKGVHDVLASMQALRRDDVTLVCIGDGQERAVMEQYIADNRMSNVQLKGFIPYTELATYYVAADVMVLPSYEEVWGLVINEALACNTPVITSRVVGAGPDMIIPEETGLIVEPGDQEALARAVNQILSSEWQFNSQENHLVLERTSIEHSIASGKLPLAE